MLFGRAVNWLFSWRRHQDVRQLESILHYHFRNNQLLDRALTHRSLLSDVGGSSSDTNETLELLGDAVLDLIVIEEIYRRLPDWNEGRISKLKSLLVSGSTLEHVAAEIHLGDYVHLGLSEERNGGRHRRSILEDTFEAVIGAIYLDGGLPAARNFIHRTVLTQLDSLLKDNIDINYKSQLLESVQARNMTAPTYRVVRESGPDHRKEFEVEVIVNARVVGRGIGRSKKSAEQNAAHAALQNQ